MLPQFIALLGALFFASSHVLVKKVLLAGANTQVCAIVNISMNAVSLWVLAGMFSPLGALASPHALLFVVVGILVPGLARWALFLGFDRVGISRSTAVTGATPLFSAFFAILILHERPDLWTGLGTLCIVTGLVALSLERHDQMSWRRSDLLFPMASAALFGMRDNMARFAFGGWPYPLLGSAVATTTASLFILAVNVRSIKRQGLSLTGRGLALLMFSGLASGLSYVCIYVSLNLAPVVEVAPLIYTVNLFTVLLSLIFLRDAEMITWRVAFAVGFIFPGIVLIAGM